uniref:Uncharacterized protein n=1 Tax=Panagrolaimus sp. ES5 TaxID=591445 RepID=A0AC34FR91_9BILA
MFLKNASQNGQQIFDLKTTHKNAKVDDAVADADAVAVEVDAVPDALDIDDEVVVVVGDGTLPKTTSLKSVVVVVDRVVLLGGTEETKANPNGGVAVRNLLTVSSNFCSLLSTIILFSSGVVNGIFRVVKDESRTISEKIFLCLKIFLRISVRLSNALISTARAVESTNLPKVGVVRSIGRMNIVGSVVVVVSSDSTIDSVAVFEEDSSEVSLDSDCENGLLIRSLFKAINRAVERNRGKIVEVIPLVVVDADVEKDVDGNGVVVRGEVVGTGVFVVVKTLVVVGGGKDVVTKLSVFITGFTVTKTDTNVETFLTKVVGDTVVVEDGAKTRFGFDCWVDSIKKSCSFVDGIKGGVVEDGKFEVGFETIILLVVVIADEVRGGCVSEVVVDGISVVVDKKAVDNLVAEGGEVMVVEKGVIVTGEVVVVILIVIVGIAEVVVVSVVVDEGVVVEIVV